MALAKQKNAVNLPRKEHRAVTGKPQKEKTTKAERRALQEAQRAAKAAAKGEGSKTPAAAAGINTANSNRGKPVKAVSQKKDSSSIAASEKKGGDRQPDKDRKKDVPHPRMQFDDANRVEKAKKRSVVKQTEAKNRVELFRHLPQYEHGTQLPELESKFFQLDTVHPAVYKETYYAFSGTDQRHLIFILDFMCQTPFNEHGKRIRFLKTRIAQLPLNLSESEAKVHLISDIDRFINEKIILADKVIVKHAVTKIRDGDVLLTYGSSSAVEMILLHAHELGKQFRVVIVDSAVRSLKAKSCFVGLWGRFHVPVLICCEAYKFHERVQLDSICSNELGDPDAISKVSGRKEINTLDGWANSETLQLLSLMYDATPSDYVSMIITDYGMIPPTSVPVIVREYRREHLWI
ncbi:UNVERIFIED_CONTAM: Translation initiation factor eIF-2B subunit delta [Sesamum angustifolium]|uniref:Translation initiation factor eIF2B subunit delta n=1 Tax=Sesamum angustifolium TaxID=2727405 RepID=A0AAW2NJD5_9LAMI